MRSSQITRNDHLLPGKVFSTTATCCCCSLTPLDPAFFKEIDSGTETASTIASPIIASSTENKV